jgi:uncharacterized phage-like protein YoqJ
MRIAFTGHRPHKLWGYVDLIPRKESKESKSELIDKRKEKYRTLFVTLRDTVLKEWINRDEKLRIISGMALGVDQVASYVGIYLRERYGNVELEAAIPCRDQDLKWSDRSKLVYQYLLSRCDVKTLIHDGPYNYSCMQDRNIYMVDHADLLIAVWDGSTGGTGNCVRYAQSKGIKIIKIDPRII